MKRRFTKYPSNYVRASFNFYEETGTPTSDEAELIATYGEWQLWQPLTWGGAIKLAEYGGEKASWATAYSGNSHYWDMFSAKGPIFTFINTSNPGEKYQSQPDTGMWFYDINDRNLGKQALMDFLDSRWPLAKAFMEAGYDWFFIQSDGRYGGYAKK